MTFDANGRYSADNGSCERASGWWVASEGVLLATFGIARTTPYMGACSNDPLPGQIPGSTRTAAFDGDVLVIGDQDGVVVDRLTRP